jgi:4a-hydroxytetrahydrobiopterin dehydratase
MTDLTNPSSSFNAAQDKPLRARKCVSCEGGVAPLGPEEIKKYMLELKGGWQVLDNTKISKLFKFKDFKEAMGFVNKVADVANQEDHHPDITIHYNKVDVTLWTHAIGGLSENDFIMGAKIDNLL